MAQELHYTSAPTGLWPGSEGYCTVACSAQMPRGLAERLEALSAYRSLFPPHDPCADLNPVAYSHLRVNLGGTPVQVVSRVGAAGLDYTNRANKYAHHVVLDASELPLGGPAWLASQPDFLCARWDGTVGPLHAPCRVPRGDEPPQPCRAWQYVTGDAGWAGVLAEAFLTGSKPVVYLVFDLGTDVLSLIAEAAALLPPERRWELTFSTYFTGLPPGVVCAWRAVVRGSPEAVQARQTPQALVLDLDRSLGKAEAGPAAESARSGRPVVAPPPPPRSNGTLWARPEAVPPRLPQVGEGSGGEDYAVVPDFPRPGGPPPQAEPRPERNPRRRRTAIVAALCLMLFACGGLVGWRFARVAPARVADASAGETATSPQIVSFAPKREPPATAVASNESLGDGGMRQADPVEPRAPGDRLARAEEASTPPQVNASDDAQPDGKGVKAPEQSKSSVPETDAVRSREHDDSVGPTPEIRVGRSEIPAPFQVVSAGSHLIGDWPRGTDFTMALAGIADVRYRILHFKTNGEGTTEHPLNVVGESGGEERPIGKFWVDADKVLFAWEKELSHNETDHAWALRWCVLELTPRNGRSKPLPTQYLLHDVAQRQALEFEHGSSALSIGWGGRDKPDRRTLWIARCDPTEQEIKRSEEGESRPQVVVFAVPGPGAFSINVRLETEKAYRLVLETTPTPKELQSNVNKELRGIMTGPRGDDVAGNNQKEFEQRNEKDRVAIDTLQKHGSRPDPLSELPPQLGAMKDLGVTTERLAVISKDKSWAESRRKSLSRIDRALTTLSAMHRFTPDVRGLRFNVTLATEIGGAVVPIAYVGAAPKGEPEPPAGPAKRGAGR